MIPEWSFKTKNQDVIQYKYLFIYLLAVFIGVKIKAKYNLPNFETWQSALFPRIWKINNKYDDSKRNKS